MFRWGWEQVEARVIDEKLVERKQTSGKKHRAKYAIFDYMVEVALPEGGSKRLVVREKDVNLRTPVVGKTVPVLVNKERTKAEFDLDDHRIGFAAHQKIRKTRQKERDEDRKARGEARFRDKLQDQDDTGN